MGGTHTSTLQHTHLLGSLTRAITLVAIVPNSHDASPGIRADEVACPAKEKSLRCNGGATSLILVRTTTAAGTSGRTIWASLDWRPRLLDQSPFRRGRLVENRGRLCEAQEAPSQPQNQHLVPGSVNFQSSVCVKGSAFRRTSPCPSEQSLLLFGHPTYRCHTHLALQRSLGTISGWHPRSDTRYRIDSCTDRQILIQRRAASTASRGCDLCPAALKSMEGMSHEPSAINLLSLW